jgi:hypothetical protein
MNELEKRVAELERIIKALGAFNTIPLNVEKAFRNRLNLTNDVQEIITNITSEFPADPLSQDVDEAGTDSYKVMLPPDYVLKVRLGAGYVGVPAFDY